MVLYRDGKKIIKGSGQNRKIKDFIVKTLIIKGK